MTPQLPASVPATPPVKPSRWTLRNIVILAAGGVFALMLLIFIVAMLLAANNIEQTEQMVRLLRDLMIIFLAMEGALIVLALAILILQIAQLINVVQNEVKPILENTQDAVNTASTTVRFVSSNVTGPLVAASGFLAGLGTLISNLFGIRQAVRRSRAQEATDDAKS